MIQDTTLEDLLLHVVAHGPLATKRARFERHELLRLTVKAGIDDLAIDKEPAVIFDLLGLDRATLLVLGKVLDDLADDLVLDHVDVLATFDGRDVVDEGDLTPDTVGRADEGDFPSLALVSMSLVDDGLLLVGRGLTEHQTHIIVLRLGASQLSDGLDVHLNVRLEAADLDLFAVEVHRAVLDGTSHVIDTLHQQRLCVLVDALHAELGKIGLEGDLGEVCLALCDGWLAKLLHVGSEDLLVLLFNVLVARLDDELVTVDVGKLGTVSVPSTSDFVFVVVVVGRGEQVTKDELGNPDFLLLVYLDRDTASIVFDADRAFFAIDGDLDPRHRCVTDLQEA